MKLRSTTSAIVLGLILAVVPASVALAADVVPSPTATPTAVAKLSATAQAARLANLKAHGATEIDRRTASLQKAIDQVTASTKLTAADKTTLLGQLNTEMTGLASLKSKLAADTTLADARTDVQSIFLDYRVYALMLPKGLMIATTDRFGQVADKLTGVSTKLQTKLDTLKHSGKDTAAAQVSLDEMKAKLADATTKTSGIDAAIINLQPADYNANHALLTQYRDALKAARADYATALTDAKAVVADIKTLTGAASPSPSASPIN